MRALVLIGLIAGLLTAPPLFAECAEPGPLVNVPDGATASREEMLAALKAIKAYDAAANAYLTCMDKIYGALGPRSVDLHKLHVIADKFNAELKTFKAKNSS